MLGELVLEEVGLPGEGGRALVAGVLPCRVPVRLHEVPVEPGRERSVFIKKFKKLVGGLGNRLLRISMIRAKCVRK